MVRAQDDTTTHCSTVVITTGPPSSDAKTSHASTLEDTISDLSLQVKDLKLQLSDAHHRRIMSELEVVQLIAEREGLNRHSDDLVTSLQKTSMAKQRLEKQLSKQQDETQIIINSYIFSIQTMMNEKLLLTNEITRLRASLTEAQNSARATHDFKCGVCMCHTQHNAALPCGHIVCEQCITDIESRCTDDENASCPICRAVLLRHNNKIPRLKVYV